jgi:hypothetical protein
MSVVRRLSSGVRPHLFVYTVAVTFLPQLSTNSCQDANLVDGSDEFEHGSFRMKSQFTWSHQNDKSVLWNIYQYILFLSDFFINWTLMNEMELGLFITITKYRITISCWPILYQTHGISQFASAFFYFNLLRFTPSR